MTVTFHQPTWTDYDVNGSDLDAVASVLMQQDEAATTDWAQSHYSADHNDAGQVISVHVDVVITVDMPRWVERDHAPHAEQVEWDRFLHALRTHEEGHITKVHEYLQHIDAHMLHHDQDGAYTVWYDNLAALQRASDEYDSHTHHGETQGTIITVPATP
jgi:predicted secreted Zn-dependent protease